MKFKLPFFELGFVFLLKLWPGWKCYNLKCWFWYLVGTGTQHWKGAAMVCNNRILLLLGHVKWVLELSWDLRWSLLTVLLSVLYCGSQSIDGSCWASAAVSPDWRAPCGALKPGLFSSPVHVLAVQCQVLVLVQFSYSCHFSVVRAWFEQSHLSLSSLV